VSVTPVNDAASASADVGIHVISIWNKNFNNKEAVMATEATLRSTAVGHRGE
jgi:hypothetical protein